jgi:hypothetical protein
MKIVLNWDDEEEKVLGLTSVRSDQTLIKIIKKNFSV